MEAFKQLCSDAGIKIQYKPGYFRMEYQFAWWRILLLIASVPFTMLLLYGAMQTDIFSVRIFICLFAMINMYWAGDMAFKYATNYLEVKNKKVFFRKNFTTRSLPLNEDLQVRAVNATKTGTSYATGMNVRTIHTTLEIWAKYQDEEDLMFEISVSDTSLSRSYSNDLGKEIVRLMGA